MCSPFINLVLHIFNHGSLFYYQWRKISVEDLCISLRPLLFYICFCFLLINTRLVFISYFVSVPFRKGHGGLEYQCSFVRLYLLLFTFLIICIETFCILDYSYWDCWFFVDFFVTISKNYLNDISKRPEIKDDNQRYQGVRQYGVSKTSVTFMYQSKGLCDVLSSSVSLRYQLVRRYDVSNWVVRRHKVVSNRSKRTDLPVATSWWCISMVREVLKGTNFFCVLCSKLPSLLRWFNLFKVPAVTLLQRLKDFGLI